MAFMYFTPERMDEYLKEINTGLKELGVKKKNPEYHFDQIRDIYMHGVIDALHILNVDNESIDKQIAHVNQLLFAPCYKKEMAQ